MRYRRAGVLAALGAALLFGVGTPLAKLLLGHASPLPLASALAWCAGIGVVSIALSATLFRRRTAS